MRVEGRWWRVALSCSRVSYTKRQFILTEVFWIQTKVGGAKAGTSSLSGDHGGLSKCEGLE